MKNYQSLADIQRDISTGLLTCSSLVDVYLRRIEEGKALNIFIDVYEEEARRQAALIDEKIQKGTAGRLAGLVIGIKDVLCHQDHTLTASSGILKDFSSLFTATAVQRILDEDAIIIGRQGCDEFAMGSSNENSCYGPVHNPIDPSRVPGGSSGASAAAVSAGMCHASLGSDTGGSVRQPAGFCGVVGMKPTYGRISRWGLIAYASSFDQIGPITRSVEDAALLLHIMAGFDPHDNTSSTTPVENYPEIIANPSDKPLAIGFIEETFSSEGLDSEIRTQCLDLMKKLEADGHTLKPLSFPLLDYVVPCYYVLTTAEASSNLSRFDGVRYGYRNEHATSLEDVYALSRTQGFGEEVKRRILLGTFVLSAGYYDAYYTQAMKVRRLVQEKTRELFQECDLLITPTTPSTAFKIGEKSDDPIAMFLSDIYTVHANLAGVPAISVPIGTHSDGLPIGIQIMGNHFKEGQLLTLAGQCVNKAQTGSTD